LIAIPEVGADSGDRDHLETIAICSDQRGAGGAANVLGADRHPRLLHGRDVDDVLRRQRAGRGHDRGADRDRRGGHRRLLDRVTALPAQRSTDATTHDPERVRRVHHGVDGQRPQLSARDMYLHAGAR